MSSASVLPQNAAAPPAHTFGVRAGRPFPGFAAPVSVEIPGPSPTAATPRLARVSAVVPCHNRPEDARTLLADLARIDRTGIDLRIILVDNASTHPLTDLPIPDGLNVEHLRLNTNTGGSGGYNAGILRALEQSESAHALFSDRNLDPNPNHDLLLSSSPDFLWLIDSDARVQPNTLSLLLQVLNSDPRIIAVGPAIADPATNRVFEIGGHINRRRGLFEPQVAKHAGVIGSRQSSCLSHCPLPTAHSLPIPCDYLAACCALIRADAARTADLFPDTFLNADDVEWFIRMAQRTGGDIVAVPWARAFHPRFDRFPTWTRYYAARNAHSPLDAIGAPRMAKFRRAMHDVARAMQQEITGRPDLARLHLLGLKHATAGPNYTPLRGPAPACIINVLPSLPLASLISTLQERIGSLQGRSVAIHANLGLPQSEHDQLIAALHDAGCHIHHVPDRGSLRALISASQRWLLGPKSDIAIVPARGRPQGWFAGRLTIHVTPGQFTLCPDRRFTSLTRAAWACTVGTPRAIRIARHRGDGPSSLDPSYRARNAIAGRTLSVEAIVLSHNRWPALESTVQSLLASPAFDGTASNPGIQRTITIIDNASRDGTPDRVEAFLSPRGIRLIRLDTNSGIEAFNHTAAQSTADALLILDDDATPDEPSLLTAIDLLATDPALGAVTLHPKHPKSQRSEWAFASSPTSHFPLPTSHFPVMGCANLIRRSAWNAVGGYESAFFLYRNDADLALKLLASGRGVYFDPALIAWHDTPAGAGARKSLRWHDLATRNWIWMAKRHARGPSGALGALAGWLWAHKLAAFDPSRHAATLKGAWSGLTTRAPSLGALQPNGQPWRSMIRLLTKRSEN